MNRLGTCFIGKELQVVLKILLIKMWALEDFFSIYHIWPESIHSMLASQLSYRIMNGT